MNPIVGQLLLLDRDGLYLLSSLGNRSCIVRPARVVSMLGDGYVYLLLTISIYLLDAQSGGNFLLYGLLAFAIERPLYLLLKNVIRRPRPGAGLPGFRSSHRASDEFSLPSGHTSAAFLFATLLSYFYPELYPLFFSIAGMIGLSRVLLGVHYPSDIAAGILLGCGSALVVISY